MLESARNDVLQASRLLARTPGFTAAAVLTLGLGAFGDVGVWVPGETATDHRPGEPEQVRTLTVNRGRRHLPLRAARR